MLRIHFPQQWFNLSDPAMEEALYDPPMFREFAGLDMSEDHLPVRGRIEKVLDYASAHKYRQDLNPARWKGNQDAVLDKPGDVAKVRCARNGRNGLETGRNKRRNRCTDASQKFDSSKSVAEARSAGIFSTAC